MQVLEGKAKSNDKDPSTEIARLQMKLIDQEERIKEITKEMVEYKISTTCKMTEI